MVEHLLPSVVELPLAPVVQEPLLGQADGLLGRRVHARRALELHRGLLTLGLDTRKFNFGFYLNIFTDLSPGHLVHGLVVGPRLLYTVAKTLGETLEVVRGVGEQLPEHRVGVVQLDLQSAAGM